MSMLIDSSFLLISILSFFLSVKTFSMKVTSPADIRYGGIVCLHREVLGLRLLLILQLKCSLNYDFIYVMLAVSTSKAI